MPHPHAYAVDALEASKSGTQRKNFERERIGLTLLRNDSHAIPSHIVTLNKMRDKKTVAG